MSDTKLVTSGLFLALWVGSAASLSSSSMIAIEDFAHPVHSWEAMNDPIMGGESTSTVTIENGMGIFDGQVVDVPFLDAPGFITMKSRGGSYPDVSACKSLALSLRAKEPYEGYRISFGNVHVPGGRFAFGYKADFDAPVGEDFVDVVIPFTNFSAKWDDATGDQIVTCEEEPKYCPTQKSLENLKTVSIWGEGVSGNIHLEIQSISAVDCTTVDDSTATTYRSEPNVSLDDDVVILESFDNVEHAWTVLNDPVMGGKSEGEVSIGDSFANFDGKVVDVPFLHAPGFISMTSVDGFYPDVSSCTALKLVLMATEEYKGYRVSFGQVRLPSGHHAVGYKADFEAPLNTFDEVIIPFDQFSAAWDDATGDQIVTCQEEPKYCPDQATLKDMVTISIWGEGVAGNVHLKINSISAVGCTNHKIEAEAEELSEDLLEVVANVQEKENTNVEETENNQMQQEKGTNDQQKEKTSSSSGGHGMMLWAVVFACCAFYVYSKRRRNHVYDPVDGIDMNLMV